MKKLLILIPIFIVGSAIAQTNISGFISSNTTWTVAGSPYIITGNTLLDSGFTLTIDPGVVVKFTKGKSLQISGTLRAIGTSAAQITFTSNAVTPAPGDWEYILFNTQSRDYNTLSGTGSIMKYCVVEYGGGSSNWGAVGMSIAFPFIDNCTFRYNANSGITFSGNIAGSPASFLNVINSYFHDNTTQNNGGGIRFQPQQFAPLQPLNIDVNIANCIFHDNKAAEGGAIWVTGTASEVINIDGNTIFENTALAEGGGIYVAFIGDYLWNQENITNNIIYNNKAGADGGGISVGISVLQPWGEEHGIIKNNIIYNNFASGRGGGIASHGGKTISNNIIANNSAGASSGAFFGYGFVLPFFNNHVIDNLAPNQILTFNDAVGSYPNNTITRNITTGVNSTYIVTIAGSNSCNVQTNFSNNNFYGNTANYEFFNQRPQPCNINANNSWWGTTSTAVINSKIWDFFDDDALSIVYYNPTRTSPVTTAPVTPPVNVVKTDLGGGNIKITWNANPEIDLKGYKIHFGSPTGFSFSSFVDVGNALTDTLTGILITDTIAVTAYDSSADGAMDMLEGHESWFTIAVGKPTPNFSASSISVCSGDTVTFTNLSGPNYSYANTTWSWSFPGGNPAVSSARNPKVIYNSQGIYSAKLVLTNIAGSDSITMANYIAVDSLPNPYINAKGPTTFCFGDSVSLDVGSGYNTYLWSTGETAQSIFVNQSGTYSATVSNRCGFSTADISVTVNPLPLVSLTLNPDTVCVNSGSFLLTGGTPIGGTYSGRGVSRESFDPFTSGSGTHTITYFYVDSNGCSNSSEAQIVVVICLGTSNDFLEQQNIVYPNPASNFVTLIKNITSSSDITLNIYNALGALVKTEMLLQNQQQINVSDLSNGIYMVEIKSKDWSEKQKLIIQR